MTGRINIRNRPPFFLTHYCFGFDMSEHIFTAGLVMGAFAFAAGWTAFLIWLVYLAF